MELEVISAFVLDYSPGFETVNEKRKFLDHEFIGCQSVFRVIHPSN